MSGLDTVAFDIETTGFTTADRVTVVGFDADVGSRAFLNTAGDAPPRDLEDRIDDDASHPVTLSTYEDESALLEAVTRFVGSSIARREVKLVAYNGETWRGGFDLPFLRTRLNRHDVDWPFVDLPYVDAMDVFEARFNTSENTLEAVYEELVGGELGRLDPFEDSAEAVDAWEAGAFEPLVRHNVADVRRTRALTNLAERYCSKSDFSMKSLSPVSEEL